MAAGSPGRAPSLTSGPRQMKTVFYACTALALSSLASSETRSLEVEPSRSTVGYSVPLAGGIMHLTGEFHEFQVLMTLDETDVKKSSFFVSIEVASIDTGIAKVNETVKGARFFNVEKYPQITFQSKTLEERGDGYVAIGEISLKGTKRVVEFPFQIVTTPGASGNQLIEFSSHWTFNRYDHGLGSRTMLWRLIGEEVTIKAELQMRERRH